MWYVQIIQCDLAYYSYELQFLGANVKCYIYIFLTFKNIITYFDTIKS